VEYFGIHRNSGNRRYGLASRANNRFKLRNTRTVPAFIPAFFILPCFLIIGVMTNNAIITHASPSHWLDAEASEQARSRAVALF
jgi:hypothetical protein